jgi:ATP-dependent Zn protease
MKNPIIKHLLATAYHEAGHAVVRRVTTPQLMVKYVTIVPDKKAQTLGLCAGANRWTTFRPDVEVTTLTRSRLEAYVMSFLAGAIAENSFTGKKTKGTSIDFQRATDFASYMAPSDKELNAYLEWLWARTEALLSTPINWRLVEVLAQSLMQERTMTGARVQKLINETRKQF